VNSLQNATLLRVDAPPGPGPGGDTAPNVPGSALKVRCTLDDPNFVAQRLIAEMELQSTAVLYVELVDMPTAASVLLDNAQVLIQQDGMPSQLMRIDRARPRSSSSVSHVECFVRAL
jgi:hypothetical protein